MEIYCKNCKWFNGTSCCKVLSRETSHEIAPNEVYIRKGNSYTLNRYNNCIHYIRKWWKFWITSEKRRFE